MAVIRRVFRQGHSWVVTLPYGMLEEIGVDPDGRQVEIDVIRNTMITIRPHQGKIMEDTKEEISL